MLVIVETRCDPKKLSRTFKLLGYDDFIATEVNGYAGGIVVAWKRDFITTVLCSKKFQYIHMKVNYAGGKEWYFTAIYASPNEENRRMLWEDLKYIAEGMNESWLVAGDFNDIAWSTEKKGGADGPKFTWRGPLYHGGQRIYERLDRALGNDKWRLEFPDGLVKVLPRLEFSDHHPILIAPGGCSRPVAPRQFRFESAWLLDASYHDMVKDHWKHGVTIIHNLTQLQQDFKSWKLSTIDQVIFKKKELMSRIEGIQLKHQGGQYHEGYRNLEAKLQD
ncbi:hypothetical protein L195_g044181, partial [Trifolium pratense]